jgi:cytoskeletal protein CcmA (bactofilin family)
MWRKQTEARPSTPKAETYAPPVAAPRAPQAVEHMTSPVSVPVPSSGATRLTPGISVKGAFSGQADMFVDGELEGSVNLPESSVTVGQNGRVSADIAAREIIVQGAVHGNLHGRERVLLGRSSRVNGDVETQRIMIEDGARFRGHITMVRVKEKQPVADTSKEEAPASLGAVSLRPKEGLS